MTQFTTTNSITAFNRQIHDLTHLICEPRLTQVRVYWQRSPGTSTEGDGHRLKIDTHCGGKVWIRSASKQPGIRFINRARGWRVDCRTIGDFLINSHFMQIEDRIRVIKPGWFVGHLISPVDRGYKNWGQCVFISAGGAGDAFKLQYNAMQWDFAAYLVRRSQSPPVWRSYLILTEVSILLPIKSIYILKSPRILLCAVDLWVSARVNLSQTAAARRINKIK